MSFGGSRNNNSSTPQPTITPTQPTSGPVTRLANTAEAKDRVSSTADPQAALLTSTSSEEEKRRMFDRGGNDGLY